MVSALIIIKLIEKQKLPVFFLQFIFLTTFSYLLWSPSQSLSLLIVLETSLLLGFENLFPNLYSVGNVLGRAWVQGSSFLSVRASDLGSSQNRAAFGHVLTLTGGKTTRARCDHGCMLKASVRKSTKHCVKCLRNNVPVCARKKHLKKYLKKLRNIFSCSNTKNVTATKMFPVRANDETLGTQCFCNNVSSYAGLYERFLLD